MTSILLVDDDTEFRTMLCEVLTIAGYRVQEASDGQQAIKLFGSCPTDLVITDLVMPVKEGLETIVEFSKLYPETKIIAISGGARRGAQECLKMAEALGAERVLAKPFSNSEILAAISEVLATP